LAKKPHLIDADQDRDWKAAHGLHVPRLASKDAACRDVWRNIPSCLVGFSVSWRGSLDLVLVGKIYCGRLKWRWWWLGLSLLDEMNTTRCSLERKDNGGQKCTY